MASSLALNRFYATKAWRDLRWTKIINEHAICARCGKSFADDTSQLIAHHIIHLDDDTLSHPEIALNPDNVEILCWKCHNFIHDSGFQRHEVYIVWGPPLSGKSTYVRQHAGHDDLIVDMDKLWQAVSTEQTYIHNDAIKQNVFALRDMLIEQVRTRTGSWPCAWVIGGYPRKDERERLASRLGAECIEIESNKQECLDRLEHDELRDENWKNYIEKWFDEIQR